MLPPHFCGVAAPRRNAILGYTENSAFCGCMTDDSQKGFHVSPPPRIESEHLGFAVFLILLTGCALFLATFVAAQDISERSSRAGLTTDTLQAIPEQAPAELMHLERAFARGDASEMMKYSAKHVDITLFNSNELYSRSQAGYVLKAFFDEYRPERLMLGEISGTEANWFAAGRYWYVTGEMHLVVYLRLRRAEFGWELREIRIGRISDR